MMKLQMGRIAFLFPLLLASRISASIIPKVASESNGANASQDINVLKERYNHSPPKGHFPFWAAMGDSFSAGPGAGVATDDPGGECYRNVGSYPFLLDQKSPIIGYWASPRLSFVSCTGAILPDVRAKQVSSLNSDMGLITLSITGNDVGFSKILKRCVFFPSAPLIDSCANAMTDARVKMYSSGLWANYSGLLNEMKNKLGGTPRTVTTIYQTAYPSFFEDNTPQCDKIRFNKFIAGPKITQKLRRDLNQLTQELNYLVSFWIDRINAAYRSANNIQTDVDLIKFVDQDEAYSGGRMCRKEITEPDRDNLGNYWYNYKSKRKEVASRPDVPASAYADIDPKTCDATSDASGKMSDMLNCLVAQSIAQGISVQNDDGSVFASGSGNIYPAKDDEEETLKTFHPTPLGFARTVQELQSRMKYRRISLSENVDGFGPKPTGKKLKIMGIGDSITWGTGSGSGYGYRDLLYSELSTVNQVTFLGTQTNGANANLNRMEGYSGKTVSEIRDLVIGSKALALKPNVVILMAGTNDLKDGATTDQNLGIQLAGTLDNFIQEIYAAVPDVTILVLHILSQGVTANYQTTLSPAQRRVNVYNAAISAMVARNRSAGRKILKVHTTVPYQQKVDVLHPNDDGHNRIGEDILERLSNAYDLGWLIEKGEVVKPNPPGGTCDTPLWLGQGQIADGAGWGKDYYPGYTCVDGSTGLDFNLCSCSFRDDTTSPPWLIAKNGRDCKTVFTYTAHAVILADLNGNGRADFLWVDEKGSVRAYENLGYTNGGAGRGSVNWIYRGVIATGVGARRDQVRFADINGDGKADYLYVRDDGSVTMWLNRNSGTNLKDLEWIAQGNIATGIGRDGDGVRFADLNGDGRAEYLWVDTNGAVTAYLNNGFTSHSDTSGSVNWINQGVIATGVGAHRENTYFADINGNKRADYIAVSHADGAARLWLNTGVGSGADAGKVTWAEKGTIATGVGKSGKGVVFADMNGDGRAEYLDVDPNTSAINAWLNYCST